MCFNVNLLLKAKDYDRVFVRNDPVNFVDPLGLAPPSGLSWLQWNVRRGVGGLVTGVPMSPIAAAGIFAPTQIGRESFFCSLLTSDVEGDEKHCFYDCGDARWTVMTIPKCDSCPKKQEFENATLDSTLFSAKITLIGDPIK